MPVGYHRNVPAASLTGPLAQTGYRGLRPPGTRVAMGCTVGAICPGRWRGTAPFSSKNLDWSGGCDGLEAPMQSEVRAGG
jgi:hypothetical protein